MPVRVEHDFSGWRISDFWFHNLYMSKTMEKRTKNPEYADLPFPLRGIDVSVPLGLQPKLTTPIGENVRGFEPITGRGRGGSRPGLSRYIFFEALPGEIQHLNFVVDPTTDALLLDEDYYNTNDFIDDPSTNNRFLAGRPQRAGRAARRRIPVGRKVRTKGSGINTSRNRAGSALSTIDVAISILIGNTVTETTSLTAPGTVTFSRSGTMYYDPGGQNVAVSVSITVTVTVTASGGTFDATCTQDNPVNSTPPTNNDPGTANYSTSFTIPGNPSKAFGTVLASNPSSGASINGSFTNRAGRDATQGVGRLKAGKGFAALGDGAAGVADLTPGRLGAT